VQEHSDLTAAAAHVAAAAAAFAAVAAIWAQHQSSLTTNKRQPLLGKGCIT
jgi:hypothetical protein